MAYRTRMYKFWSWVRNLSERKMNKEWFKPSGGCDSCCPRCKQWESLGNIIHTKPLEDGSDKRSCTNCGYVWLAIFTPAGFIPIDDYKNEEPTNDQ